MTLYSKLIETAEKGGSFFVDFDTKSLTISGKKVVDNGKYDGEYGFLPYKAKDKVEELFDNYFFSVPSERSGHKKQHFVAAKLDDLSMVQLASNERRIVAQAELEGYILGLILSNCPFNEFDNDEKHWFWQSQSNKNLILYRRWFE